MKVRAVGSPVPVSAMVCSGLPTELSLSVTDPGRVPAAVGLKVTLTVQLWPGPSVAGQSAVWA